MQLDIRTSLFVSGVILATIGLATLFYSMVRKENQTFIWSAMACGGYAVTALVASFRDIIPDFWTVIVANELGVFSSVAFFEVFRRLLLVRPWEMEPVQEPWPV